MNLFKSFDNIMRFWKFYKTRWVAEFEKKIDAIERINNKNNDMTKKNELAEMKVLNKRDIKDTNSHRRDNCLSKQETSLNEKCFRINDHGSNSDKL